MNEFVTDQSSNKGVLYIVFGDSYMEEAKASIQSVRQVSPGVRIAVVTDHEWRDAVLPDKFVLRETVKGYSSKPRYMYEASPFEETLFIDTDTYVARDVSQIFGLLKYYDIGVRFGGPQLRSEPSLELHTQCNSGVVLFKKNIETQKLFESWQEMYVKAVSERRDVEENVEGKGLGDQRYLALAIAMSRARPVHLASYLNFTLFDTIATYSPPRIYHGRTRFIRQIDDRLTRRWNQDTDWHVRVWLTSIKGVLPRGVRRSDPVLATALVFRRIVNEVRYWLRSWTQ